MNPQDVFLSMELKFATGFLCGLAVGVFSRLALKVIVVGAFLFMAFEMVKSMGML